MTPGSHRARGSLLLVLAALILLSAAPRAVAGSIASPWLHAAPVQHLRHHVVVALRAGAGELVGVSARGHVRLHGHKLRLRRARATVRDHGSGRLELRARRARQRRRILRAVHHGRTLEARIHVRFRDLAGHLATRRVSVKLT